ncbi:MAG: zinc ribbon domain-containing protein [Thermoplasmata archaeon]|nr:zinc ribbon domain-containing protein [Thermoplasmata archaeon]
MVLLVRCGSCSRENAGDAEYCIHCGKHLGLFRKCVKCGIVNSPDAATCKICGAELGDGDAGSESVSRDRPGYRPKFRTCPRCGRNYDNHLVECPHCERKVPEDYDPTKRSSSMPMATGTILFLAGILCIFNGVFLGSWGGIAVEFAYCGFVEIMMGIIAITGWVFCMQRTHLVYVIAVAVITIFSVGPFFLSSLLGFIALVLIAVSAKEFR